MACTIIDYNYRLRNRDLKRPCSQWGFVLRLGSQLLVEMHYNCKLVMPYYRPPPIMMGVGGSRPVGMLPQPYYRPPPIMMGVGGSRPVGMLPQPYYRPPPIMMGVGGSRPVGMPPQPHPQNLATTQGELMKQPPLCPPFPSTLAYFCPTLLFLSTPTSFLFFPLISSPCVPPFPLLLLCSALSCSACCWSPLPS